MRVLITGADGFIGSHLTEFFVRQGFDVRAFVLYNSFNSWGWLDHCAPDVKGKFEVFSGDIRDPQGVRKAIAGCDAVIHLAALIGIPYSYHSPNTYLETNINGTLNILNAALDLGVSKLIHTSTSEVYGTAEYVPIDELHPLKAQSPYAATKIGADQMALSFFSSFELPVAIARPFNTYGPRQSARAVIPSIISQIAAGKREIFLGSISPTRDFNFINDTVNGFLAILESDQCIGQVFNLGSNFEVSIHQTALLIAELMGTSVKITNEERRFRPEKSEVERLWADNSKAKQFLDWEPAFGGKEGFERGLTKTIEWFLNHDNLTLYKTDTYNV